MQYIDTPVFGFVITIVSLQIGNYISKKTKAAILNPLFIAIGLIMSLLILFDIDYEIYNKGGSLITFFVGPATVALAVPLYRQIKILKGNSIPIIIGIIVGTMVSIISIIYLSKLFGLDQTFLISLVPKSSTTAISQEVSAQIGGIPALSIAATIVTGITGYIFCPYIFKIFRIKDKIAIGIALGTISHASGTAKAMELGEIEGAMASLAIGLAGLATVLLAPWIINIIF